MKFEVYRDENLNDFFATLNVTKLSKQYGSALLYPSYKVIQTYIGILFANFIKMQHLFLWEMPIYSFLIMSLGKFLTTNSTSLMGIGLSRFSIFS